MILLTKILKKFLKNPRYYLNPYRIYYRFLYYFPFGIRRINHLKEVEIKKEVTICRLEIDFGARKHHNFIYVTIKPNHWFFKKWFYWLRKFAFQLPGYDFWFKAPKLTPWDYNPETGELRFGLNYSLVTRLKEKGVIVEQMKFITWI